jgi:hypothetical protein
MFGHLMPLEDPQQSVTESTRAEKTTHIITGLGFREGHRLLRRAQHGGGDGVVQGARILQPVEIDGEEVRTLAGRQRADIIAPEHGRAAERGKLQRLAGRQ